ncbi:DUF3097 family protein [Rothia terrae]|uniref:DUF3097 domain-containing protein n=1 Tax=Rothia terrae TaxID=396015 RepID=A0A7H2BB28_9MICC|nr:DUF3097 family protein [Rothia terrae]QNV36874.1 DUF3097 domain-containing protein [Rothia terrae]
MSGATSWGAQDLSVLAQQHNTPKAKSIYLQKGLLLEDVQSGWVGIVVSFETIGGMQVFGLEDAARRVKKFPLGPGFLLEGEPVIVVAPKKKTAPSQPKISRSGSIEVENAPARVARASRIWVEGTHDAELIEKVWGHDLRVEGIVVEPLHGVDDLAGAIQAFGPSPQRKLGVLVDHLVTGTKESRIVEDALRVPGAKGNVLVVGHPFVDVWQAIKPKTLGLSKWPVVPRTESWKEGILKRLGMPHSTQAGIAQSWKLMLSKVDSYSDLEPQILGPVEQLIDFLTVDQ